MLQSVRSSGVDHACLTATERHAGDPSDRPDTVVEMGSYTFYNDSKSVLDKGKYVVVWNRGDKGTDSKYKLAWDMFSSNGANHTA